MIKDKIIKQASKTDYYGLKKNSTHKSNLKNKNCGDIIFVELIVNKNKIKSMRYETKACIYCQASASYLASTIKGFALNDIKDDFKIFKDIRNFKSNLLPKKYKKFLFLFDNENRKECSLLPFIAILKACK
tara:strand:+ start:1764 stop:2156 length:393 start_codon:yes stop_codon:yes gene_type:complete